MLVRIVSHMSMGWAPARVHGDPVQWMPREHNKVADGLADLTMDIQKSWARRYRSSLPPGGANVVVQTDGGLRDGDCAASAWIIGLWGIRSGAWTYEPLVAGGVFLDLPCTVFKAEAIALDEASREVVALLTSFNRSQTAETVVS